MTMPGKLVTLAALAIATASSGCLYQREVVRDPPPPVAQGAPPPQQGDPSTQPPAPPADDDSAGTIADNQGVPPPGADVNDDGVFYERLAPYGHWEWVPEYGRVWVPAVASGWRPYVYGRWVLTDWGWTWASDDPWAWAAYHYGTWGFTGGVGWFWVPGHVWAPAWVTWRWGFGYCAWAPIGPRGFYYGYSHPGWVAVRAEHFTQPISVHAVSVQRTSIIVQRATPLAAPRGAPARGGSFGPPVAQVTAATGRPVRAVNARVVVAPRTVTTVRPSTTAAPVRAQSPMQSPRAQPQATSSWRGAARPGAAGSWRTRQTASTGSGAARVSSGARVSGGAPARGGAAGGAPRAAPSAPRSSGGGGGGGTGAHSGGARASGGGHGHGR